MDNRVVVRARRADRVGRASTERDGEQNAMVKEIKNSTYARARAHVVVVVVRTRRRRQRIIFDFRKIFRSRHPTNSRVGSDARSIVRTNTLHAARTRGVSRKSDEGDGDDDDGVKREDVG